MRKCIILLISILLFAPNVFGYMLDDIPAGSEVTWTYEPHDPNPGIREWGEVTSPFDGTTALEQYMAGCDGTCGSYNIVKEYVFTDGLDRDSTVISFDAKFELLGGWTHNRSMIQTQFYDENNSYLGQGIVGYGAYYVGTYGNVPDPVFVGGEFSASGTWEIDLSLLELAVDPYMMKFIAHTRSCYDDARTTWDNIQISDPLSPAIPEPATMLLFGSGLIGLAGVRRKYKK